MLWKTGKTVTHMFFETPNVHMAGRPTLFRNPLTGVKAADGISASGCGPVLVARNGYFGRHGMVYDRILKTSRHQHTFRGGCWQDCIPANGLLVTAPYVCACNYSLRGWIVQSPAGDLNVNAAATEAERLLVPGSTNVAAFAQDAEDWPTPRGGVTRSGFLPVDTPATTKPLWTIKASTHGQATSAVSVGGSVFIAGDDGVLRAVSGADGKEIWSFKTTGRIHVAPSVAEGRVYVGSADGYAYALEAAGGRLLWRFRAGPAERRIMTYGHLSSNWPVNTGVLVADGTAYFGAGLMDSNGTHVYALDAVTGKIKWQMNKEQRKGVLAHGKLTIAGGKLWMGAGSSTALASYDLADGKCTIPSHTTGVYRNGNRGREIGFFGGDFLIQGGQQMHMDQAEETVMQKDCEMTYTRIGADGTMRMPPVIPFDTSTAMPVWDERSLLSPHIVGRETRIACQDVPKLKTWLSALQASREEAFKKRKGWMAVTITLTGRTPPKGEVIDQRPAPDWELSLKRTPVVHALALTKNAVVALLQPGGRGPHVLSAINRSDGKELWRHELPGEPLFNAVSVTRDGRILVTLWGYVKCRPVLVRP